MTPFGTRLRAATDAHGPLCAGLDPHRGLVEAWGLDYSVAGLERFAMTCVEAFAGHVAVVKPQSAFFEVFGSAGVAVLERVVADLRSAGTLVLVDAKRGDIGSTMAAYASAYLDPASPLAADAITVSPYLGVGALAPAFELAALHDRGVFTLALTSNPEATAMQNAVTPDGRTSAQTVVEAMAALNSGAQPLGSMGVVVGATIGSTDVSFAALNGPILSPGVGAQGGSPETVRALFGDALPAVLPSVSREVLRHGPDIGALRSAVASAIDDFAFLRA